MPLVVSCVSCRSKYIPDPEAADRIRSGGSIAEESNRLAVPLIRNGEIYGAVVGVVTPEGNTHVFSYGNCGGPEPRSPASDTLFGVGSLSKIFTVALFQILVEEGQLNYDDTVASILPAGTEISREVGAITLGELAGHSSGLPREPHTIQQLFSFHKFVLTGSNFYSYITEPYLYKYLGNYRPKPTKKGRYVYSNIGTGMLAHLIELKTGMSVSDLINLKICKPLGMRDTVFIPGLREPRVAIGHAGDQPLCLRRNAPVPRWELGRIMRASAGMYSTVDDLMIFAKANLGMLGHSLEPTLISMQRVRFNVEDEGIALGWIVTRFDGGRVAIVHKHGMVSGYSAYIGFNPARRIAVVVLCNNLNLRDKIGYNLLLRLSDGIPTASSR